MAILNDIFSKRINRPIEGVIKADDASSLLNEIEEYVLTNEVQKSLSLFLSAYNDYSAATQNGVWISGFFGSGKSHLLKMLSLLLELKSTYESLADGELTLQINGFAGKETLKITVEKGIPRVEKTSEHPELVLEHLDALRLFFMHKAPARSTLSPVPRSWLPLPIYVYSADNA